MLDGSDWAIAMIGTRNEEIDSLSKLLTGIQRSSIISYLMDFVQHAQHSIHSLPTLHCYGEGS
jgi:hypothetical protein